MDAPPKFGAKKINPGTGRLTTNIGKGDRKFGPQLFPHRDAINQVTKGDPQQQSFQNYAKLTPSGANAPMTYQDIIDMASGAGASVLPK